MRLLGWTHTENRCHMKTEADTGMTAITQLNGQEMPRIASHHQMPEETGRNPSHRLQKEPTLVIL